MATKTEDSVQPDRPSPDAASTPTNTPFIPLPSPLGSDQSSPLRMSDVLKQHPRNPSNVHQDSFKSIRREEDAMNTTPQFFRKEYDNDIDIFDEPPQISVLDARMKDSWRKRFVEYDVQIKYKKYTWQIELTKSAIYGLWFYVKKKPHLVHNLATFASQSQLPSLSPTAQSGTRRRQKVHFPQLRKFFLAKSEQCIRPDMIKLVEQYLNAVVHIPRLLHSSYVVALFQVSRSTFDQVDGKTSLCEGWLRVRSWMKGNRENVRINRAVVNCDNECVNCICVVKRIHLNARKWRWVSLKHSSIAIYDSIQAKVAKEVFLIDARFNIERGLETVGSLDELVVSNSTYVLQLEGKTKHVIAKWAKSIREAADKCSWSQPHRDDSFAVPRHPHRVPSFVQWYVDGEDTYRAIYEGLLSAKREIFIQGWWICPDIHLLRPAIEYPESRLDRVIKKRAEEGIKVYVLMYKEVAMALTLNSLYSKTVLSRLHPNVSVLRDPDFIIKNFGMWSHHEKIVCIDQSKAFVGGLDLCFGRWDTKTHVLFDQDIAITDFLGKDYSNPRIKDFVDVQYPEQDLMDRTTLPRMPWHDVHCRLIGQPARDVARHFIQRWNYSIATRRKSAKLHRLVPMKEFEINAQKTSKRFRSQRLQKAIRAVRAMNQLKKAQSLQSDEALQTEKDVKPSMADLVEALPANKSGYRGFERVHKNATQGSSAPQSSSHNRLYESFKSVESEGSSDQEETKTKGFACSCQIVRSISFWSGGCPTERSIQNAYIRLISSASHFIYIENQFFISGLEGDHLCSNRIANALVERIRRAAANQETFRVIVLIPLLPAFPGQPNDKDASSLRGVLHWQYRTISRGKPSIYHTLYQELDDPFEYIAFYGLRTFHMKEDIPHTEEVYIHSKMMIVDDRSCIIGSANINERSMRGDRDSEIAVVIDDTSFDESIRIANGASCVGKFCHSFRMRLFEEHFGLEKGSDLYKMYLDPVNEDAWFAMQEQAMKNSHIYESIFMCMPSDSVVSFSQMQSLANTSEVKPKTNERQEEPQMSQASPITGNKAKLSDFNSETDQMWKENDNIGDRVFNIHPSDTLDPLSKVGFNAMTRRESSEGKSVPAGELGVVTSQSMRKTDRSHLEELEQVQGNVVYLPLKFLADEILEPKLYPAELFQ
uniref:Phospholipase n=1 Tax=Albugo laibachii Nc14 TaxID=890382 RepID=F0WI59_9STRA|nr:phospholipase D putative [Albugo laibachii Nc14]|eukprot:CCA20937.1 phospholipase D putative [Albugo laibachii Nc14]